MRKSAVYLIYRNTSLSSLGKHGRIGHKRKEIADENES